MSGTTSILVFLGFMVGMVAFAMIRAKMSGVTGMFLEDWKPEAGEEILFEDRQARFLLTPHMGKGDLRPNAFIVVTNRRILAGQRPLYGSGSMITHMLYVGRAPGAGADSIGGGLFQQGYQTLVVDREVERVLDSRKPYVELSLSPSAASSFNTKSFRIYTAKASSFPPLGRLMGSVGN